MEEGVDTDAKGRRIFKREKQKIDLKVIRFKTTSILE